MNKIMLTNNTSTFPFKLSIITIRICKPALPDSYSSLYKEIDIILCTSNKVTSPYLIKLLGSLIYYILLCYIQRNYRNVIFYNFESIAFIFTIRIFFLIFSNLFFSSHYSIYHWDIITPCDFTYFI